MTKTLGELALKERLYPEDQVIAFNSSGAVTWADLQLRTQYWQTKIDAYKGQNIAAYHSDGIELLAILFALWRLSKTAIIPPNTLDFTVQQVSGLADLLVGEIGGDDQILVSASEGSVFKAPADTAFVLFTSGSTSLPEPVIKTFSQLDAELNILDGHYSTKVSDALVAGTVSHHHMYGLVFRLLLPLASGRAFISHELYYFERIKAWQLEHELVLITSPAHLENIPGSVDLLSDENSMRAVFSAGAPLSEKAAENALERLGCHVSEIYGSTETGAIAWRSQLLNPLWSALPQVLFDVDTETRQLKVKAPSVAEDKWYRTADCCNLVNESQFSLEGRVDKVIKVGGKRISLTSIEQTLLQHPWVDQVKLVLLHKRKSRLAAAVILNSEGNAELIDHGKLAINRALLGQLKSVVEPAGLPRYWRYLAQYPHNSQGKTLSTDIEALFYPDAFPKLPSIIEAVLESNEGTSSLLLDIPDNLFYFAGHFPGNAILPGVVQTSWAIHYGHEKFGSMGQFQRLENLKFQRIIKPGVVRLNLKFNTEKRLLQFSFVSGELTHSSGRIQFKP